MAQYKAIFIGRPDADTGLSTYRQLPVKLNIYTNTPNAFRFLPKHDLACVSGYLAILEALAAGIPVLAYYNNAIKYDYLFMAPFAEFIHLFQNPKQANLKFDTELIVRGQKWAKSQTWNKLADIYEKLWQK